jgi:hypothetical protein
MLPRTETGYFIVLGIEAAKVLLPKVAVAALCLVSLVQAVCLLELTEVIDLPFVHVVQRK